MSYMGIALQRIAQDNGRTQKEIAQAANVAPSQLNRLFSGAQTSVEDDVFASILSATGRDPRERAEIVAARCRDVKTGPGSELVEITVRGAPEKMSEKDSFAFGAVELPHEDEKALAFITSQIPLRPALSELIRNLAQVLEMR